jgi:hypothetical protein
MALDFCQIDDSGTNTSVSTPIHVQQHGHLIHTASSLRLDLVLRMSDYYDDVVYEVADLPRLAAQLARIAAELAPNKLAGTAVAMRDVVLDSIAKNLRVEAIAD